MRAKKPSPSTRDFLISLYEVERFVTIPVVDSVNAIYARLDYLVKLKPSFVGKEKVFEVTPKQVTKGACFAFVWRQLKDDKPNWKHKVVIDWEDNRLCLHGSPRSKRIFISWLMSTGVYRNKWLAEVGDSDLPRKPSKWIVSKDEQFNF